jgi:signal recognition particle subunit SEC65
MSTAGRERPMEATVKDGALLMELEAREAGRRKHKAWRRVSAADMAEVLKELGFKIVVWP